MHLHTFRLSHTVPPGPVMVVTCDGCEGNFRLANADEARIIVDNNLFSDDGPMLGPFNVIVIPKEWNANT